jgi:ATP-binding cassette subfamily F protein 3
VCDEFWLVSAGGVQPFDGDIDDYQRWLLEQSREAARAAAREATAAREAAAPEATNRRDERKAQAAQRQKLAEQAKPLKTELKKVERRLAEAGAEREAALAALSSAQVQPAERAEQGKRLKALDDEIEALELRWLELGEALEQLG